MKHRFNGRLCGYICSEYKEPLANAVVRLYRPADSVVSQVAAIPKHTFGILDEAAVQAKEDRLIAEAETDDDGAFTVEFDADRDLEAFVLDARVTSVEGEYEADAEPVQFTITTVAPRWKETERSRNATWQHCLSKRYWCQVRAKLGAWVICGRVTECETEEPVDGLTVEAFDTDIIQDDSLGSAMTGNGGRFRIYYSTSDFEKTPLPPVNLEMTPGPDLFFKVTSRSGRTLLDEDRSRGRDPDRENVDNCHSVEFCVPLEGDEPDVPDERWGTAWTRVGGWYDLPDAFSLGDFDADGYAGSGRRALGKRVTMDGQAPPRTEAGNKIEYRFLVSEDAKPNGQGRVQTGFTPITDAEFVPTRVGLMARYDPASDQIIDVPITVNKNHVDADGWVDVDRAIDDEFNARGMNRNGFTWVDEDPLLTIDTERLVPANPEPNVEAGEDISASERYSDEKTLAVRFEIREVVDEANGQYRRLPGDGITLNSMRVCNDSMVAELDIVRSGSCNVLSGTVDAKYTVHHPLVMDADMKIRREGDGWFDSNALDLENETAPTTPDYLVDDAATLDSSYVSENCTYTLRLYYRPRLHWNNSNVDRAFVERTFYYE